MKYWLNPFVFYLHSEPNKDMQVLAGSLSVSKPDPGTQTIPVKRTIKNPNYRETNEAVYNDIGDTCLKCLCHFVQMFFLWVCCDIYISHVFLKACWSWVGLLVFVPMRPSLWKQPVYQMRHCLMGRSAKSLDGVLLSNVCKVTKRLPFFMYIIWLIW